MSEQQMKQELFKKAYGYETEIIDAQEFLKELKAEYTYDSDTNTDGLSKDVVAKTLKAAKAFAKQNNLKEKAEELMELDTLIEELS